MDNRFDGFSTELFLDETGDWVAHFLALPNVSAFASTPEQAMHELKEAWEAERKLSTTRRANSYCALVAQKLARDVHI